MIVGGCTVAAGQVVAGGQSIALQFEGDQAGDDEQEYVDHDHADEALRDGRNGVQHDRSLLVGAGK